VVAGKFVIRKNGANFGGKRLIISMMDGFQSQLALAQVRLFGSPSWRFAPVIRDNTAKDGRKVKCNRISERKLSLEIRHVKIRNNPDQIWVIIYLAKATATVW
jgi:hypothetical protein